MKNKIINLNEKLIAYENFLEDLEDYIFNCISEYYIYSSDLKSVYSLLKKNLKNNLELLNYEKKND